MSNNDHQEFSLDDILNEFLSKPEEPEAGTAEPDIEPDSLLTLPDLTIAPVTEKIPEVDFSLDIKEKEEESFLSEKPTASFSAFV